MPINEGLVNYIGKRQLKFNYVLIEIYQADWKRVECEAKPIFRWEITNSSGQTIETEK